MSLTDKGVQLIDANGDGQIDLLVTTEEIAGYYPQRFGGLWDRRSFQRYRLAPSFDLKDPEVKMVDLDGDGVTDAIRSGTRLECFFNDAHEGWTSTRWVERLALEVFPNVNFSDPRVKWGDMTGDGLQDIVLVYNGIVQYWPSLGRGDWGPRITMQNSPDFPYNYDPRRILVGDVDGDGLADIVYVDDTKVTLWINQSGNSWSSPIVIEGTPPVSDMDAVRLDDMLGTGIRGVLWSSDANGLSRVNMFFLDFTGGAKPYVLNEMDNHMGAVTRVGYAPSTHFYLEDEKCLATRWKTTLPFPVQVLARPSSVVNFLNSLPRRIKRDALRAMRGRILRTELYALDGTEREDRPYTVTEHLHSVREESPPGPGETPDRLHIFFPHTLAERTTQWERGNDPMHQFKFTSDYDEYGQLLSQSNIAVPRGRDFRVQAVSGESYLAAHTLTTYAKRDDAAHYIVDRVARTTTSEIKNDGTPSLFTLQEKIQVKVTDATGLDTQASYDYRVLQPKEVTDPNGNRTIDAFTPLGLLESTAVIGKNGEGDTPDKPSTQFEYSFPDFAIQPEPIFVRTIRRVHHITDTSISLPERDETIETVEYSDGFGRLLQTRTQAEDVLFGDPNFGDAGLPADQSLPVGDAIGHQLTAGEPPNVVVSGWQIYDNKGCVVEKYEPFFSKDWDYAPPIDAQFGQKVTMYYDPRGQVIRTVNPDGSEQLVIYGIPADLTMPEQVTPTPWEVYTYDANDNAGRTHPTTRSGSSSGTWLSRM